MNNSQPPTTADGIAARVLDLITKTHNADDLASAAVERSTDIQGAMP
ncbi:hypothetical protein [Luteimonas panaciterrae]|nr:hypothetical protein [Luteimonas panaciterrae]